MQIIDIPDDDGLIQQMAELLVEGFREPWHAWETVPEALEEIRDIQAKGFIRVAVEDGQHVLGWVGGLPEYDGHVWELHPLVVRSARQGQGIGRALVADFEQQVARRGGLTIMLGSDDVANMTSLGGVDLYENLPEKLANIQNFKRHPYEFYLKCGYHLIGVVPDANGRGKPDVLMGKRVGA